LAKADFPLENFPRFEDAPSVILVTGDVAFFVEEAANRILEGLGGEAEVLRFVPDAGADAVSDALANRSLFSPRRAVLYDVTALFGADSPGKLLDAAVERWTSGSPGDRREAFRLTRALLSGLDLSAGDPVETAEAASKKTRRRESAAVLAEILRELPEERGGSAVLVGAVRRLLERGNEGTVAVLTATSPPAGVDLIEEIGHRGLLVKWKIGEDPAAELTRLGRARAKEREVALDGDVLQRLLFQTDDDPRAFAAELDKLLEMAQPGGRVTAADVRANVEDAASEDVYPFYDAIGRRDAADALARLQRLFSDRPLRAGKRDLDPDPYAWPMIFLGMVTTELRRMLLVRAELSGPGAPAFHAGMRYPEFQARVVPRLAEPVAPFGRSAFASADGQVSPFLWYKAAERAARYTARELARALAKAAEVDVALKTSAPPLETLTSWVAGLIGGK
jgi:DNA polymerase III delta subunit